VLDHRQLQFQIWQWRHFLSGEWRFFIADSSHQSEQEVFMKIAFTTSTGETIDQHFGQCQTFHIWEVGPDEAAFQEAAGRQPPSL